MSVSDTIENCDNEVRFAIHLLKYPIVYSKSTLYKEFKPKRKHGRFLERSFKVLCASSKNKIQNKISFFYFHNKEQTH